MPKTEISTWRSARSFRRCSTPRIISTPGKEGPQNYSLWDNKEFQALTAQIDREVDAEKRQDLIRQAEAVMEQDPPLLPISWEKINDIWYNYVKGHNPYEYFGVYDVVRLDTVWLDKS